MKKLDKVQSRSIVREEQRYQDTLHHTAPAGDVTLF